MKWITTVVCAIALLATGYFGAGFVDRFFGGDENPQAQWGGRGGGRGRPGGPPTAQGPISVDVSSVVRQDFDERVTGTGRILAEREVDVPARVEGIVQSIEVELGDAVKAGAVLCRIDEAELTIAVDSARIEMEQAEADYERFSKLSEGVAASPQELDDRRFTRDRLRAAHERALLDLTYARPVAPFDGVITSRTVEVGGQVSPNDVMFQIADLTPLQVDLFLPERDVARVKVGAIAELALRKDGPAVSTGRVTRVSPVVDRESLTVAVEVSFEDASSSVRPGAFGRVDIITREIPGALAVPVAAIQDGPSGSFVWTVDKGVAKPRRVGASGNAKSPRTAGTNGEKTASAQESTATPATTLVCTRVPVEIGIERDGVVQVTGELPVGAKIVVAGGSRLSDGAAVEVRNDHSAAIDRAVTDPTAHVPGSSPDSTN